METVTLKPLALIPLVLIPLLILVTLPCVYGMNERSLNSALQLYADNDLTAEECTFVASHFNLVNCGLDLSPSDVTAIKAANANCTMLGYTDLTSVAPDQSYYSTVNANEDWFMHDTGGHRVVLYGSSYVMNQTDAWFNYWLGWVDAQLGLANFDGIFMDNVWNNLQDYFDYGYLTCADDDHTLASSEIDPSAIANWKTYYASYLSDVKSSLIGKTILINTDEYSTHTYIDSVDGKLDEGWIGHPAWYDIDTYASSATNIAHIDAMARDSPTELFIAHHGLSGSATTQQINDLCKFSMAASLMGCNTSGSYFLFNSWTYADGAKGYYSIMDADLGAPASAYNSSQSVYMRPFTKGLALFNPSTSSHAITLPAGIYEFTNGTDTDGFTMAALNGELLYYLDEAPDPTPTPSPTAAYFLPDSTSGLDGLIGIAAVFGVFILIAWPFVGDKIRERF